MSLNKNIDEDTVAAYQELLKIDLKKWKKGEQINIRDFLREEDISRVCNKYKVDCNKLKSYLINYSEYDPNLKGYHTPHFDLIYRLVNLKTKQSGLPVSYEFDIELDEEPVPDFDKCKLEEVLTSLNVQNNVVEKVVEALKKSVPRDKDKVTISTFQKEVISTIFNKEKNQKNEVRGIGIVAPTASGKTLSFLIPVLVKAVQRVKDGRKGVSSLLIYPRKALERDQLKNILKIIDRLNEMGIRITIGIDDGDTPRVPKKENEENFNGKEFRGLKCVKDKCQGKLIYSKVNGRFVVKCNTCGKVYDYIYATKEDIWNNKPTILISNIYTVYRRLMHKDTVEMFKNLDYIVLDEVHVYTDFLGGHVHYILKMLKYVARESNPTFIFSSATISEPKDFLTDLFGQEVDIVNYFDIFEKYKIETKYKRLIIRLYILPNPQMSIETLYQLVALATTLWAHKFKQKVISFIDSIAEIATLEDYIKTVILEKRKGREVKERIEVKDPLDGYSWITLAQKEFYDQTFLTTKFKDSIRTHHSRLDQKKRGDVESEFQREGNVRHLMATSTLELGIDISDVAVVIQYKLPMTLEGFIQRIGRAGRNPNSFRIALGIILLPPSPIGTLYMYDKELRERFTKIKSKQGYGVGYRSDIIKLQALFSLVLFRRALKGKETYMSRKYLKNLKEVENAINEILYDLNDIESFNSDVGLLSDEDLKRTKYELQKILQDLADVIGKFNKGESLDFSTEDLDAIKNKIDEYIDKMQRILSKLNKIEKGLNYFKVDLSSVQNTFDCYKRENEKPEKQNLVTFLECSLKGAIDILRSLRNEIEWALNTDVLNIDNWLKQNEGALDNLKKNLIQLSLSNKEKIRESREEIISIVEEAEKKLEKENEKPKYTSEDVIGPLYEITGEIIKDDEEKLSQIIKFLIDDRTPNNLSDILKRLKNIDVISPCNKDKIETLRLTLQQQPSDINIFEVINELYGNRIRFNLLLEPPFLDLESDIERGEDNE